MRSRFLLALLLAGVAAGVQASPQSPPQPLMGAANDWRAAASDQVIATLRERDGAPCLAYDFNGVSGHASLRREVVLDYPAEFEFRLRVRGEGPSNAFQFKLVDASGENVWWVNRPGTRFAPDWQPLRYRRRHVDFAWGPTADKILRRSAAIEFVVYAESGGSGEVCVDGLLLQPLAQLPPPPVPRVQASSARGGSTAGAAVDGDPATAWRSRARGEQRLQLDLGQLREFGGLLLHWAEGAAATDYVLEQSDDAAHWREMRRVADADGGLDALWLPESEARHLRLRLQRSEGREYALQEIELVDVADGTTQTRFLQRAARALPRGRLPRGFHGEQSYWTLVGVDGGSESGLLSEDGALELARGDVSLEPFLVDEQGRVASWADAAIAQSLADGYLPLPRVDWQWDGLALQIEAFADGDAAAAQLLARYTLRNTGTQPRRVALALALRPFQVNPPTQFLTTPGGIAPIRRLAWDGAALQVDGRARVYPLQPPQQVFASRYDSGLADTRLVARRTAATAVEDETGLASAALRYEFSLAPGAAASVGIAAPLIGTAAPRLPPPAQAAGWLQQRHDAVAQGWRERLDRVALVVPAQGQTLADSVRSAHAQILMSRSGPMLRPGTRSYARSWIRDGAMIAQGLLRLGDEAVARDYLEWYAPYQFTNGKVPCCVDARGADPVPENDSHGELIHLAAEVWRYGGDRALLQRVWPRLDAAVRYMDELRASERGAANRSPERRAFYGLMPASISHEGYSAKPMHSYWDDFWALTGYKDAVLLAAALGRSDDAQRIAAARDEFRADLMASLLAAVAQHGIDYLPGCAELGDFDPTSTTIALAPAGEQAALPPALLRNTFERYWREFVARRDGRREWKDYTPYEWRNVASFVRLGWRERAAEAVDFFFADRRPQGWNQWAEVIGRLPREPRFIGDMPHAWVGSDFIRAALDLFAYERYEDKALVIAAGIPAAWLDGSGIAIRELRTPYGRLSYTLARDDTGLRLDIAAGVAAPGGIVLPWPLAGMPGRTTLNGAVAEWKNGELYIASLPARVEMQIAPQR